MRDRNTVEFYSNIKTATLPFSEEQMPPETFSEKSQTPKDKCLLSLSFADSRFCKGYIKSVGYTWHASRSKLFGEAVRTCSKEEKNGMENTAPGHEQLGLECLCEPITVFSEYMPTKIVQNYFKNNSSRKAAGSADEKDSGK